MTEGHLEDVRLTWERLGETDPLVAILGENAAGLDEETFLESGRREVSALFQELHRARLAPAGRGLDFGCGLGRLTQALCDHLASCDGVDIARSMVEGARRLNRFGERCRFHLNSQPDLRLFDDGLFDLVYSGRVLQHMPPQYAVAYIREFVRVARPGGGVVAFQIPSRRERLDPLPLHAMAAAVTVARFPDTLGVGATAVLQVTVTNHCDVTWPARGPGCVRIGNHWRSEDGELITRDDGRVPFADGLQPGGIATIDLTVRAPATAGRYRLEVEPVQEGVAWFAQRGFEPLSCLVDVVPLAFADTADTTEQAPTDAQPEQAQMEMHAVHLSEVVEALESAGARIAAIVQDDMASGWESYQYFAVREPAR